MAMKKCAFCGTENQDSSAFCDLCGRRFESETEEAFHEPTLVLDDETERTDSSVDNTNVGETVHKKENLAYEGNEENDNDCPMRSDKNDLQTEAFVGMKKSSSKSKIIGLFIVAAVVILLVGLWLGPGNGLGLLIGDDLPDVPPVDMNEKNDSMGTATIAQVGNTYKGVLSSTADKDYFCIPANGHSSLSYTFRHNSSRTIDGIGWEISHTHTGEGTHSRMAWLNNKEVTGECDDIDTSTGYFYVWIENTRSDPDEDEVMGFVSYTEYSIVFSYGD